MVNIQSNPETNTFIGTSFKANFRTTFESKIHTMGYFWKLGKDWKSSESKRGSHLENHPYLTSSENVPKKLVESLRFCPCKYRILELWKLAL